MATPETVERTSVPLITAPTVPVPATIDKLISSLPEVTRLPNSSCTSTWNAGSVTPARAPVGIAEKPNLEAGAGEMVNDGVVAGWDDPRMPTLAGIRRRGFPPAALRDFCERIGVTKQESVVEVELLEHCVREELNRVALRRMAVLKPLKLTLVDWPAGRVEELDAVNNPEDAGAGSRKVPFTGSLWIERE